MKWLISLSLAVCMALCSCAGASSNDLERQLNKIVADSPGTVGIAFVTDDDDTLTINNSVEYPMMSVYKLHQSLAAMHRIASLGQSPDSLLTVSSHLLDRDTWSPMMKDYTDSVFDISIADLIRYAITVSDNNASNLLFSRIISPAETDAYVKAIAPDSTFHIFCSEADMKRDHSLSYTNHTSPLSAALLIRLVFSRSADSFDGIEEIRRALSTVTTGQDRLGAVFNGRDDILFAHKTGSGYRDPSGILMAHNDVAYIEFPDGRNYALAVMIRDFKGSEAEASAIMATVAECVYNYVIHQ